MSLKEILCSVRTSLVHRVAEEDESLEKIRCVGGIGKKECLCLTAGQHLSDGKHQVLFLGMTGANHKWFPGLLPIKRSLASSPQIPRPSV